MNSAVVQEWGRYVSPASGYPPYRVSASQPSDVYRNSSSFPISEDPPRSLPSHSKATEVQVLGWDIGCHFPQVDFRYDKLGLLGITHPWSEEISSRVNQTWSWESSPSVLSIHLNGPLVFYSPPITPPFNWLSPGLIIRSPSPPRGLFLALEPPPSHYRSRFPPKFFAPRAYLNHV